MNRGTLYECFSLCGRRVNVPVVGMAAAIMSINGQDA